MSALSLRLPDSLHEKVRELAEREGISINQLVATAVAEKMSALLTLEYLQERARRGSGGHLAGILRGVRDVPAMEGDEWVVKDAPAARTPSRRHSRKRKARR